ncbi:MAG TPA: glucose-1-phosphate cytidylyltransferase [Chthoniobacteraceae bacterium]|jgi:glucose-1-phosphate cytidylyltransferase|nr:glucose-1-phosphate cytidylyltransferase [Chthoniobacteraceae bacterium]
MKVVILCGGRGTRLREETEYRPKPMVPIGNRPILWHIMKIYAHHGHKDFILCLGYKGEMIRDYFRNYLWNTCDTTLRLGTEPEVRFHTRHGEEDWTVTLADTGENSMTAYRVHLIRKYLGDDDSFLLTYGDGVGNIDVNGSIRFHKETGKICAMTAVHPPGRFGELGLDPNGHVHGFNEKPQAEGGYINGGFMVCSRRIFDYLPDDPRVMLEQDPMRKLTAEGQLAAFRHEGFWQPMDTYQEFTLLNDMWEKGNAPWKVW